MAPLARKNDAQWAPPPSQLTTLVKAFAWMCTRLVSTIPVVAVARSQPLPHRLCRKRYGTDKAPPWSHLQAPTQPPAPPPWQCRHSSNNEEEKGSAHRHTPTAVARSQHAPFLTLQAATARSGQRQWQPAPSTAVWLYHGHLAPSPTIPQPPRPGSGRPSGTQLQSPSAPAPSRPQFPCAPPHWPSLPPHHTDHNFRQSHPLHPQPPSPPPTLVADHSHTEVVHQTHDPHIWSGTPGSREPNLLRHQSPVPTGGPPGGDQGLRPP
jgi:hypothetical protein